MAYSTRTLNSLKRYAQKKIMLPEKEVNIAVPWGKISLLTWGDPANEPVFLCHGKQDVSTSFRPLVKKLPHNYFYVSVDLPGNGKSTQLPKGVTISIFDFIPSVKMIMEHFGWKNFIYIGHSLGVLIGKYFSIVYPNVVKKMIDLDPVPGYLTFGFDHPGIQSWYSYAYGDYYKKYKVNNAPDETAPRHTYEKAISRIMHSRNLSEEAAQQVAERAIVPTGDGLYRFSFDQRMKSVMFLPLTSDSMKTIYTDIKIPILSILAKESISKKHYDQVPFIFNEKDYKHGNYSVVSVEGQHDVHLNNPERVCDHITNFLENGIKAKL